MQNASVKELTILSIIVGVVIGVIMTAANTYLGLYAGMTVSASIPAAVISMGIFRGLLKRNSILESNIVQTMASAGESLAAGIIFTLPALLLVGAWNDFQFWPTTLIAISGGLLGVVFMIPLRKALIVEDKNLTYPEGVACASVLDAGASDSKESVVAIGKGLIIGGVIKFLASGMGIIHGSVEWAKKIGNSTFFLGTDVSPALLAVGYIVKLEVAMLVFIGGALGWFIGIPFLQSVEGASALDSAWTLWSTKIRYVGVGAMIVGGVWSIIGVRKGIASGLSGLKDGYQSRKGAQVARTERDMNLYAMMIIFLFSLGCIFFIYNKFIGNYTLSFFTTVLMGIISFLFVAVSSYIVGLVGSSNNPVSGMTISALLGTAVFFLVLGYHGQSAIFATLGVAAVVCCAACTAGDCSQDLKTGQLVGATPANQQIAQLIGVVIPAFVLAPVLTLLHSAYGIGTGLKAPQATLFASITKALFGSGNLPYEMIYIGMILAVLIIIGDKILDTRESKIRLHLMPIAVGIYLPITLAVPILLGGIVRKYVDRKKETDMLHDKGVLLSSGLIAGEAIMGIIVAIILYVGVNIKVNFLAGTLGAWLSFLVLLALAGYLYREVKKSL